MGKLEDRLRETGDPNGFRSVEEEEEDELKQFKPTFYGFTGGIRAHESMEAFINRINKESGR